MKSERYVLTFENQRLAYEAGLKEPIHDSNIIKQYGRRLVLNFVVQVSKDLIWEYYEPSLQYIELDELVTIATNPEVQASINDIEIMMDSTPDNETTTSDIDIEWQFAASSPFGLQVENLWPLTNGSLETRIAVLDSGIASIARNEEWFVSLEEGYDFVSDPEYGLDGDGRDTNSEDPGDAGLSCPGQSSWHGTKMAFGMAGKHEIFDGLHSVAWNTTIQPLRVLGLCSTGFANDVTDAIVWAAGGLINGLGVNPHPSKIISMSFGGRGRCPSYLQSAISMAINQFGVIVLAAAGNQASNVSDFFPANCLGVISIGASTRQGFIASYSNRGPSVLAAGGDLSSPIKTVDMDVGVSWSWGTSFSTSFVAGLYSLGLHLRNINWKHWVRDFNPDDEVCANQGLCGIGIASAEPYLLNTTSSAITETNTTDFIETESSFNQDANENPQVQAQTCSKGNYAATGSTVCYGCAEGKYSTVSGVTSLTGLNCQSCATGTWSAVGSSLCSGCIPLTQPSITVVSAWNDVPGYYVHRFGIVDSISSYTVDFSRDTIADVLLVGGGGGAGKGGGGAGAVIYSSNYLFVKGTYTFTVGGGGATGNPSGNGGDTIIKKSSTDIFLAKGGGGGGQYVCNSGGKSGASGGGGGSTNGDGCSFPAGAAVSTNRLYSLGSFTLGYSGGTGRGDTSTSYRQAGGGGGAGETGKNSGTSPGAGGKGLSSTSWGGQTSHFYALFGNAYTSVAHSVSGIYYIAGGGSGGGWGSTPGTVIYGGYGGGGNGLKGQSSDTGWTKGRDYCGAGGGGSGGGSQSGGVGGHGMILIRYSKCQSCPKGTFYIKTSGICEKCDIGKFSGYGQTTCQSCPSNSASPEGSSVCNGLQGYSLSFASPTSYTSSAQIASVSFPSHIFYFSTTTVSTYYYGIQYAPYVYIKSGSGTVLMPPLWPAQITSGTTVYRTSSLSFVVCTGSCSGGQPHCLPGGTTKICCGPGYFFRDGYDTTCQQCLANTFSSTGAATSCTSCTGGLFSNAGASVCIDCTITKICTTSETKRCVGTTSNVCCSAGQYFRQGMDTTCQSCLSGTYSTSGGSEECLLCSAGSYSSGIRASACKSCEVGKYQDEDGQQTCKACYGGSYQSLVGQLDCTQCGPGKYSTGLGMTTSGACLVCQPGTYEAFSGSTACETCDAGSYQSRLGEIGCELCFAGSYSTGTGASALNTCQVCAPGRFQDSIGMTSCLECPPGTSQPSNGSSVCISCDTGKFSANGPRSTLQNACGEFMENPCTPSSSSVLSGLEEASLALDGDNTTYAATINEALSWWVIDLERPKAITGGLIVTSDLQSLANYEIWTGNSGLTFNDSGNIMCLTASFTLGSGSISFQCETVAEFLFIVTRNGLSLVLNEVTIYGLLNYTGTSACELCAAGTYQSSNKSFSCTPCPTSTTSVPGSKSLIECFANAGYYGLPGSVPNPCPENYYCPTGSSAPISCPSLYQSLSNSISISDCVAVEIEFEIRDMALNLNTSILNISNNSITFLYSSTENVSVASCASGFYCPADSQIQVACPLFFDSPPMSSDLTNCTAMDIMFAVDGINISLSDMDFISKLALNNSNITLSGSQVNNVSVKWTCIPGYDCVSGDNITCPVGAFCPNGSVILCPPSTFNSYRGAWSQSNCSVCSSGTYSVVAGSTSCTVCDFDFWCEYGIRSPCPPNTTSSNSSSSIENCTAIAGYYALPGNSAVACPANYYCPKSSSYPMACPLYYISPPLSSSLQNCTSLEIYFEINGVNVSLLDPDFLTKFIANATSNITLNHSLANNVSVEWTCGPGYDCSSEVNVLCPSGSFCPNGQVIQCPPRTFNSKRGSSALSSCVVCEDGTYAEASGSSTCNSCNSDFWCQKGLKTPCPLHSFSGPNAKTVHDCRCHAGYFCLYSKSVAAVISLKNVSVGDFNGDVGGVRTAFISAVAKAAGVDPSRIQINNVVSSVLQGRRLLALGHDSQIPLKNQKQEASKTTTKIDNLRIEITIRGESHHSLARPLSALRSREKEWLHIEEWNVEYDLKISKIRA